jgi:hypothetical protein
MCRIRSGRGLVAVTAIEGRGARVGDRASLELMPDSGMVLAANAWRVVTLLAGASGLACASDGRSAESAGGGSSVGGSAGAAGAAGSAASENGGNGVNLGGALPAGGPAGGASGTSASGAAGTSAGAAGGIPGDPASFCESRSGLAFCEDFESFAVGPVAATGPWSSAVIGEGSVSVDETQSHSGRRALRVLGSGYSSFLVYHDTKVLPAQSGRFYLRAYLRLAEEMTAGHNTFIIGDMAASPGAGNALRLGEMHQMLMYTVSGDTHGRLANENFYNDQLAGAALKAASWACVEMLIDSSGPELRVWLDGAEIPDLYTAAFPVDPYDALRFGFEKYAGPESEIFYDDLAIGSEPIGCN